jgi:hypothetical protein
VNSDHHYMRALIFAHAEMEGKYGPLFIKGVRTGTLWPPAEIIEFIERELNQRRTK